MKRHQRIAPLFNDGFLGYALTKSGKSTMDDARNKKLLESFFFPLLQTPYEIFLIDHCPYSYFVRIKVNKNK